MFDLVLCRLPKFLAGGLGPGQRGCIMCVSPSGQQGQPSWNLFQDLLVGFAVER